VFEHGTCGATYVREIPRIVLLLDDETASGIYSIRPHATAMSSRGATYAAIRTKAAGPYDSDVGRRNVAPGLAMSSVTAAGVSVWRECMVGEGPRMAYV
jgi:hypothetical protein